MMTPVLRACDEECSDVTPRPSNSSSSSSLLFHLHKTDATPGHAVRPLSSASPWRVGELLYAVRSSLSPFRSFALSRHASPSALIRLQSAFSPPPPLLDTSSSLTQFPSLNRHVFVYGLLDCFFLFGFLGFLFDFLSLIFRRVYVR